MPTNKERPMTGGHVVSAFPYENRTSSVGPACVSVLGIFRGGTSSVATAIARAGVFFGNSADLAPASEQNLAGNWELRDLQTLNARILLGFGMNFFQADALPADWPYMPGADQMVADIRATFRKHFSTHPCWGWKEPSTSLLMPLYKQALEMEQVSPRYAICVRHPLSVAKSQRSRQIAWGYESAEDLSARAYPIENRTIGLWLLYTLYSLKETQGNYRQLFLYDRFLESPQPYLERLLSGLKCVDLTPAKLDEATESVKPQWRHSQFGRADLDGLPDIVSRTYEMCCRIDEDPDGLANGTFDHEVDALWDEWLAVNQLSQPIPLPFGQMYFSWQGHRAVERKVVHYAQTGTWQTVKAELDAPPGATVQLDLYQSPCQVWVRKATWHFTKKQADVMMKAGPNGSIENLGVRRVNVFGPGALMIQAPPARPAEIELEFMVQNGQTNLNMLIAMLRERMLGARKELAEAFRVPRETG